MHKLNYIFKNINLLNLILIATIILLANYTFLSIFNKSVKFNLPPVKQTTAHEDEKLAESSTPSPSDYTTIAEENLFHPERKIPVEKTEEKPLPKPEFVLYGTLITDDLRMAYLEDLNAPQSTQGRGKRQLALRLGNSLSGYTLLEISHDKVIMAKGDDKIEVRVINPSKQRTGGKIVATKEPKKPAREAVSVPPKPGFDAASRREMKNREKELKKQLRPNKH
jgi:type II secretory pathway component PulC